MRRFATLLCVGATVGLAVPTTASAATCSQQDRLDHLLAFFDGWSRGDAGSMALDRRDATAPFGTSLPRATHAWRHELLAPRSRALPSVRAWLQRRTAAGDRITLLRARLVVHRHVTGGTLSFRRTSPDIRGGHKLYGVAKFEVRCNGLTAFANGRSWWNWTTAISVCHPGKVLGGARFCGRLP